MGARNFRHDRMPSLELSPIGIVRSPFREKYEAPRQAVVGIPVTGAIQLLPGFDFEQALRDLEGFERIWVLYWFHKAGNWKPLVVPPRATRTKRGVFATRAPHRPNPIGMSCVRLLAIKGLSLTVEELDLVDGTPVLDIKPYLPYSDAFPDARSGWVEEFLEQQDALGRNPRHRLQWSEKASRQVEWLEQRLPYEWRRRVDALLAEDPLPHPYKRIRAVGDGRFQMALKRWRLFYRHEAAERLVVIDELVSGYPDEALNEKSLSYPGEAIADLHREFNSTFS